MSWKTLRTSAIIMGLLSVCMLFAGIVAGLNDMDIVLPFVLGVGSSVAGYLFWTKSVEHRQILAAVSKVLESPEVLPSTQDGEVLGFWTHARVKEIEDWVEEIEGWIEEANQLGNNEETNND